MNALWEKQEFETSKRYKLFCIYRDLGITRSLNKVCDELGRNRKYRRALEMYSSKDRWVMRCEAYDLYLEEQARKQNEQEIKEMKKRHIQQSLLMQKNVISKIQEVQVSDLSLADCVRMFDVAVKIERLSRDCDTSKLEVNNKVVIDTKEVLEQRRLEKLTPDELEELEKLIKKMDNVVD